MPQAGDDDAFHVSQRPAAEKQSLAKPDPHVSASYTGVPSA